jgi:hypothetical protein
LTASNRKTASFTLSGQGTLRLSAPTALPALALT